MSTAEQALIIMDGWRDSHRLTKKAWREAPEIARRCADELGPELPDNDITHGRISMWLRKQEGVELK